MFTEEYKLREIFSSYGVVQKVQIVVDAKTGKSRGFGFIYFENCDQAKLAKEHCSGMEIDSRKIRVDYSITKRAHTPTPGIYMGRPTITSRSDKYSDNRGYYYDRDEYYYRYKHSRRSRSPSYYKDKHRHSYRSRSHSYSRERK